MTRCLVTGATGFVGANLVRLLLDEGHEVSLLVRQEHKPERLKDIRQAVQIRVADIADAASTRQLLADLKPEWVFHLAANGAYSWQNDVEAIFRTNLTGLINLLESSLAAGCTAFVNAGSSSEYGYKDHPPGEDEIVEPNSYYAVAKAAATQFCRFIAQNRKAQIATLRLYSAYGPFEDEGRLIPTIIKHALQKKLPPLVSPDIARDYVFVDDVNRAFVLAAKKLSGGEIEELGAVFNIGTGIQTSIAEVVTLTKRLMEVEVEPVWGSMENRRWDTSIWVANNKKAERVLGWKPVYDFERGLARTIEWTAERESENECIAGSAQA